MYRRAAAVSGGLLVLFHAWLLARQVWDGALLEPALAIRWLLAAGLVAALVTIRMRGASIVRGRRAVSIWLLAALLHGPAMLDAAGGRELPALPEAVATVVQLTAVSILAGLCLLFALHRFRRQRPARGSRPVRPSGRRRSALSLGLLFLAAPRPPPHLALAFV